uniref:Uncharacterized protein n=1 Tax=Anguilla anguilla TaxID=7936 RepID=A0A0E9QFV6_ANGAN
MSHVGMANFC